jgi:hypothetical protein
MTTTPRRNSFKQKNLAFDNINCLHQLRFLVVLIAILMKISAAEGKPQQQKIMPGSSSLRLIPDCPGICRMKYSLRTLIGNNPTMHPKLLRLGTSLLCELNIELWALYYCYKGFHSCVGGCNGCLDVAEADNAGLKAVVEKLDKIYNALRFDRIASKADFYALTATMAAQIGIEEAYQHNVT